MRIYLAGGTGIIGRRLVRALVDRGHTVTASSRDRRGVDAIEQAGARGVVVDHLDRDLVLKTVSDAAPEVVVHQLTAITVVDPKHFDRSMAATNELRTTGFDFLLEAAALAGASRLVAQSFTGWTNPAGRRLDYAESDPLDPSPHRATARSLAAIAYLEQKLAAETRLAGAVVRYGQLYGPDTAYGAGGATHDLVLAGKFPVVGGGEGIWSFVDIDDAVEATVLAIESNLSGPFNIVDDEPAPVHRWLPAYAKALGAPAPKSAPALIARLMIGGNGVRMMTAGSGSSNRRARTELGWTPRYPSWSIGFDRCTTAVAARQNS